MKGWLLLAGLALATPVHAADFTTLAAGIVAGNLADFVTTERALQLPGAQEANPIGQNPVIRRGLKAGVTGAELFMVRKLWTGEHRRAAVWLAIGVTVGNSLLAVHNARLQ